MTHSKLKILIVEDSLEDRHFYKRLLQEDDAQAYDFLDAETADEGLDILTSEQIHCVLLDYNLPDMDGIEFLDEISREPAHKHLPVIFLTGQGNEMIAVQAMKNGATDYLVKGGLSAELLIRTVHHATDKKNADRALAEHITFVNTLIDTIPNPIFYKDTEGRIVGCNLSLEKLLGIPKEKIIGKTAQDIVPQNLTEETDKSLLKNPGVKSYETTLTDAHGTPHEMLVYKATYMDMNGKTKGLVCTMLDITERKKMEKAILKTTQKLEQNVIELERANRQIIGQQKAVIEEERLKVLLQMAGATAHELNQPLMILLGNIELLGMDQDNPEKAATHIKKIEQTGHRIADIVKKIQTIRHHELKPYGSDSSILNIDQSVKILSIEDTDEDYERIKSVLTKDDSVELIRAFDFKEAFQILESNMIDLIFLDYLLPSGTGTDFLQEMENRKVEIPVVMITGQGDEMIASKAIQAGAYDYLPKSTLSNKSISRVITNTLEKHRLKQEVKKAMKKMAEMSSKDELTGLYNRRYFIETFTREKAGTERYGNDLSLCIMDLDHFKTINDTYGHPAGDEVLRAVAQLICKSFRKTDISCRYGGEEFAVIFPNTRLQDAESLCERFRKTLENKTIEYQKTSINVTVSMGLVSYNASIVKSEEEIIQQADKTLYDAKNKGRNRVISNP